MKAKLAYVTGDLLQADVETDDLYSETSEKFDIYHINVNHRNSYDQRGIVESFSKYLDDDHFRTIDHLDDIADEIVKIVVAADENNEPAVVTPTVTQPKTNESGSIIW